MKTTLFFLLGLTILMSTSMAANDDWKEKLRTELPLLGHRNWIVVADSAYPLQTAPGIETVFVEANHIDVVRGVIAELAKSKHVKPTIFTDTEAKFITEAQTPGITAYRDALSKILASQPIHELPHEQIIAKLDEAGKAFKVLLLKTPLTKPYTSVFFQLECGYWNAESEKHLRESMAAVQTQPSLLDLQPLRNPVWVSGDNLRDPSVLKTKDGYHLFYSRFSGQTAGWGDPAKWHIAQVFTKDFVTFTNDRDISPTGCASPGDVVWWHGRWVLPFQTYPSKPTQLVFAESTDLVDWSAPRPFLAEALTLPWNELQRVIDPSFVVDGDTLHCWFVGSAYHTNQNGDKFKVNLMGHASTRDPKLEKWEITTRAAPLIGISPRAPDGVENTMVFRTEDHWTMIYSEGLVNQHLARATSPDLVNWKLEAPVEISRQQWMTHKYGAPFVWRDGNRWMMILMGTVADDRTTFGLLTSTDGTQWKPLDER